MDIDHLEAADPHALAGQQVGATLVVKRCCDEAQVGDFVQITEQGARDCTAKSLRTGQTITLPWVSFFPLKYGERCGCDAGECRCECENRERHVVRQTESSIGRTANA